MSASTSENGFHAIVPAASARTVRLAVTVGTWIVFELTGPVNVTMRSLPVTEYEDFMLPPEKVTLSMEPICAGTGVVTTSLLMVASTGSSGRPVLVTSTSEAPAATGSILSLTVNVTDTSIVPVPSAHVAAILLSTGWADA